jgi:hypothetical protein
MLSKEESIVWLQRRTAAYRLERNGICEIVEDFDEVGKLGQGFTSIDELEEVDLGDECKIRPTYINASLTDGQKARVCCLLREFMVCFAWDYTEMPGLNRSLVEHTLPIKPGFRPHKQPARSFTPRTSGKDQGRGQASVGSQVHQDVSLCPMGIEHSTRVEEEHG